MKKSVVFVLILTSTFVAVFCAPKPAIGFLPEWSYAKDAIRLRLKSDPHLNLYQGSAHTLLVCVYSLKDPNAFTQMADEKDGIPKLLECGRFDPSVTQSKRFVVQPGKDVNESLDRPEGAKYVGVAAGYYDLRKEGAVRFFPIPVTEVKRGSTIISEPGVLNLNLTLGPQQLQEVSPLAPFPIASKPDLLLPAEWRYAKDAIRLHLKGDPRLNFYQGNAHTLLVCVYSLKDPNAFAQLADEKDGIPKLLECGRFDPSVTQSKRFVVQPGKDVNESLDRPEGAKYVGVVAGYYDLRKERAVRFFPIPVTEVKRGSTIISEPGGLDLNLTLGPQQLQEFGGK